MKIKTFNKSFHAPICETIIKPRSKANNKPSSALTMQIRNYTPNSLISKQRILVIYIQDQLNINIKGNASRY